MKKSYNKAFTLVELLAVIVILAIILVIAVPKIMDVISTSKKSTLETSVKMIASTAEKTKMQNTVLGKEDGTITCDSVAKLSASDYDLDNCIIKFDGNTAKVTVKGKGKFEGLSVCRGTKNEATATSSEEGCPKEQYSIEGKEWSEIVAAAKTDEYKFIVGETKEVDLGTLGTHTLRIANITPCSEVEVESKTACGFVLEFADVITNQKMNSTNTNAGGWPKSAMRTYVNETIYNALPEVLRSAIIDTTVVSSHGYNDRTGTLANNNFESTDKLYLLSTMEVYGSNPGGYDTAASDAITRQLDYYQAQEVSTSNYSGAIKNYNGSADWWWLRSAYSVIANYFYSVSSNGGWDNYFANYSTGVSPAFRLTS